MLNKRGPSIKPCGTSDNKILWVLFIVTFCLCLFKYAWKNITASIEKPKAYILAIKRSWGIESKVLGKTNNTTPRKFFWSKDFC